MPAGPYRVATRLPVPVVVRSLAASAPMFRMVIVATPDAADDWIAERITPADVSPPVAARCVGAGRRGRVTDRLNDKNKHREPRRGLPPHAR